MPVPAPVDPAAQLTILQAYDLALAAGFVRENAITIVCIAMAESKLMPLARNGPQGNNPPSLDRGILQINDYWHPEVSTACADDPACAFKAAYTISDGTDFSQWSTWSNGLYSRYYATVTAVVAGRPT